MCQIKVQLKQQIGYGSMSKIMNPFSENQLGIQKYFIVTYNCVLYILNVDKISNNVQMHLYYRYGYMLVCVCIYAYNFFQGTNF